MNNKKIHIKWKNSIQGARIIKKAFTFVELMVVVVILSILSTIWFIELSWNISDSRDSIRKSNFAEIKAAMKLYKTNKWSYPIPWDSFRIDNLTLTWIALQWKLLKNTWLSTIDEIPYDPFIKIPYFYSITWNKQEFQIAWSLENDTNTISILDWDYKSVSQNILPTLMLATWSISDIDISLSGSKNFFIFDNQWHNLAYPFIESEIEPYTDWSSFTWLLDEAILNETFFQTSSFETCDEIKEAWKYTWTWIYQIRTNTWAITSTGCTI